MKRFVIEVDDHQTLDDLIKYARLYCDAEMHIENKLEVVALTGKDGAKIEIMEIIEVTELVAMKAYQTFKMRYNSENRIYSVKSSGIIQEMEDLSSMKNKAEQELKQLLGERIAELSNFLKKIE